jgi:hypothetical protein
MNSTVAPKGIITETDFTLTFSITSHHEDAFVHFHILNSGVIRLCSILQACLPGLLTFMHTVRNSFITSRDRPRFGFVGAKTLPTGEARQVVAMI